MRLPQPGSVLSSGSDRIDTLRRDEEFVLSRCLVGEDSLPVLMLAPATERPPPRVLERLRHEYSLRERLESAWAAKPRALADEHGRTVLLLDDPGTEAAERPPRAAVGTEPFCASPSASPASSARVHAQGLIHRDIKPDHLFVDMASGAAWLTGFGIASRLERERQTPDLSEMIAQTLAYMAPEQTGRMNRSADARSGPLFVRGDSLRDVDGHLPFQASGADASGSTATLRGSRRRPANDCATIPETVSALVLKLLAKNAEDRYQTAAGVETDLRRCPGGPNGNRSAASSRSRSLRCIAPDVLGAHLRPLFLRFYPKRSALAPGFLALARAWHRHGVGGAINGASALRRGKHFHRVPAACRRCPSKSREI